jgi:hypothetical protein
MVGTLKERNVTVAFLEEGSPEKSVGQLIESARKEWRELNLICFSTLDW